MTLVYAHYGFADIGIPPMQFPDCRSVYVIQDAYTRQFYPATHDKFLAVSKKTFADEAEAMALTPNHGVIDTFTAMVCLTYESTECTTEERIQFDALVGIELARMFLRGDRR